MPNYFHRDGKNKLTGFIGTTTPAPLVGDILAAVEEGRKIMSRYPTLDDISMMLEEPYHFIHGGRDFFIPASVPLIPDPSMTERVLIEEDAHSWVEYDEADLGWRLYFGFVRYEERPVSWVRILDITCPVTGKRTRAVYAHPETIKIIRQVHRVVPTLHSVAV